MSNDSKTPHVYSAIAKVMARLTKEGIGKDRKNEQQGYKFRGIDDVYNALAPYLSSEGLVILPRCLSREVTERQTQRGGTLFYVNVDVEFHFVSAIDGSSHVVRMPGEAMDSADKATNKAMSAAFKYACLQAFCIPTEGDNDADATTHSVVAKAAQPAVSSERAAVVRRVADSCIAHYAKDDEFGTYEEAAAITDPEERVLLWSMLHDHSKVRSCIKRIAELERNGSKVTA